VISALRTDLHVLFEGLAPDDLSATLAFEPQSLSPDVALGIVWNVLNGRLLSGKPCHRSQN
jgi:hypothetical protein